MNYTEWKQEYLELLIKLIKQHEYSKNHSNDAINELMIELLELFYGLKITSRIEE